MVTRPQKIHPSSIETSGIVLAALGHNPTLEDIVVELPGPGEVRVRIVASGICHTDLDATRDARACPVLLGHEGAGVVEAVGEGVARPKLGDHVVINWQVKCGKCRRCVSGRADLCEDIQGTAAPRVYWRAGPLNVLLNAGTFCPFVTVPAAGAVSIRRDMPLNRAALLGCAVATGIGAVFYTAKVQASEGVAVFGAGGVGLNVIQGAKIAGASLIIAIDVDDDRLAHAALLGATHILNNRVDDPVAVVQKMTAGRGVEHVFEVVGKPALMAQGIDMLARGGALTLVGAAPRDALMSFNPRQFMSRQQTVQGCIYGNIDPQNDLPKFANWYMDGALQLDQLETASVRLEDVPKIFAHPEPNHGIRTIIEFNHQL
ncbi:MAG TPA: zinc-binding dehydrogenase [Terriglobia bacterium]|nr:zinc-binding dehydrogenase [Terriglobia bacterium]